MSLRDRDLISIQESRYAVERAHEAQKKFAAFSQQQVDAVVEACANAATEAGESLARLAVEETGYGNVPDKITKNRLASIDVPRAIRNMRTVGIIREDREKGIIEIAAPVGVVAAVIPSTNPTSTAIYKTLISLKAQNAIVLSPHPTAMRCICESAAVLRQAALKMGAPEDLITCLEHPTMQGTQELMKNRLTGVILATGGTGLVRAAYSSGRPAYGVGPGNVPALIERTANVKKAVADIFAGKTFDYGTICSSEQAIVTEEAIREQVLEECRKQDAYFLSADEIARLGALVFLGGAHVPNTQVVGRPATTIAEMAGVKVPPSTRVLIAQLDGIGRDVPLSAEKLSPILAFYSAPNLSAAIGICVRLLEHGGAGHTASIHSQSEAAVKQYGLAIPAFRIAVNTSSVHGSIGYSTNLFPAMTLGCGSPGGNITSDNIGPQHLMNVKRVAWESRPVEHRTIPADQRLVAMSVPVQKSAAASAGASGTPASSVFSAAGFSGRDLSGVGSSVAGAPSFASSAKGGDFDSDLRQGTASAPEAIALKATLSPIVAAAAALAPVPDRQTIARIVEQVFTARGIPRRRASAVTSLDVRHDTAVAVPKPDAEKVTSAPEPSPKTAPIPNVAPPTPHPLPPPVEVAEFLSENDVRMALTRDRKLYIGPKTILTPSARDLGNEHDIFVMTDIVPAIKKRRFE
ncbi:MAG TPA: aldehyde dehydrogenase family protein [Candidatus Dormibacteraeota bacterium]|nr:aldehyde dehydrogenase family protein [Candidatus Dormibacteraeota bacterium]